MIEGPRIPRSCDPDWGMRDEDGYIKPEYNFEYFALNWEKYKGDMSGGFGGGSTTIASGDFDDLKDRIANLTKEEAQELFLYLKDKI